MGSDLSQFSILGVDTGGTFTDFVLFDGQTLHIHKVPSTPERPDDAVMKGIEDMNLSGGFMLHYGTTVATNAFLERKGARIALLTTAGFEDVVVIGRQNRDKLYSLCVKRAEPFVSDDCRIGVRERIDSQGAVILPLTSEEIKAIKEKVVELDPKAIAVLFLFSFINPSHEKMIGDALKDLNLPVFLSSEVFPEYREYERTVVTGLNAYLSPIMENHLNRLSERAGRQLRVMASGGGIITARQTIKRPIETLLSGPAAGVIAAAHLAGLAGFDRLITFDMGGTSTDVSLVEGKITMTVEAEFGGLPIRIPMIDIRTIGAGGGSIAEIDVGGALKVGPESAGASPGPICYGKGGGRLTVTDANLFLGRIHPDYFLGGRMKLTFESVRAAMDEMAASVNLTAEEMAEGIIDVANTNMERILRVITVERGHDPGDYVLIAFGGAGGLHAADLADRLGIPRVMIPRFAGAISALGSALTDMTRNLTQTILLDEYSAVEEKIEALFESLIDEGKKQFQSESIVADGCNTERFLFIRYKGQSYELQLPYKGSTEEAFREFDLLHEQYYGFRRERHPREIVNFFVRLSIPTPKPEFPKIAESGSMQEVIIGRDLVYYGGLKSEIVLLDRENLPAGYEIVEPALVIEATATTLIPPGWIGRVDELGNILIERLLNK
jgi:N-methylhydantoinase A